MRIMFLFLFTVVSQAVFSQATQDTTMTMAKVFEKDWVRYFERKIDLNVPIDNGCKSGTYKVVIQFRIDKKGDVQDIIPLTNNGFGMEELVSNLIKKGPSWIQVLDMKNPQSIYKTQPVIFILGDGKPDNSNLINVSNAAGLLKEIFVYTSHQGLVFQFV